MSVARRFLYGCVKTCVLSLLAKPTRRGTFAMREKCSLFVQDHTQERAVNLQSAVVVDKA
jgi:hypothetical protein